MSKKETKILYSFDIAHIGWEGDNKGYVVENEKGKRFLKTTSHGSEIEVKEKFLDDKIKEYQELIRKTRRAKQVLRKEE